MLLTTRTLGILGRVVVEDSTLVAARVGGPVGPECRPACITVTLHTGAEIEVPERLTRATVTPVLRECSHGLATCLAGCSLGQVVLLEV